MTLVSPAALLPPLSPASRRGATHGRAFGQALFSRCNLAERSVARAAALVASGIERAATVVVGQPEGATFILDVFATWTAGTVAVAVNPKLTPDEQIRVLASTGAKICLRLLQRNTAHLDETRKPFGMLSQAERLAWMFRRDADDIGNNGHAEGCCALPRSLSARLALNIDAIGRADLGGR